MRKLRQDIPNIDLQDLKQNQSLHDYITHLKTQIRSLGSQIDYEFQKFFQCTFSVYKHFYSSSQCSGEKANFMNKLSNCGIQWNLQSQFELKSEQQQQRAEEHKQYNSNQIDQRQYDSNRKGYNMRIKTKPLKYKTFGQQQIQYIEKANFYKEDIPRRGRPIAKKDVEFQQKKNEPQVNPYEKAPYKKRKHYNELNQEHNYKQQSPLKQQNGKNSVEEQKNGQIIVEIIKNSQQQIRIEDQDKYGNLTVQKTTKNDDQKKRENQNNTLQDAQKQYKLVELVQISQVVESYRNCLKNMKLTISIDNDQ